MAEFIPERIEVSLDLLEEYVRAGEFELLETIDYRNFSKSDLHSVYKKSLRYSEREIDDSRPDYDIMCYNIDKCLNYIKQQICENDCWELKNYKVYTQCFRDANYNCIHKVFNKTTQTYCTFTGKDINTLMAQDNIKSSHFHL